MNLYFVQAKASDALSAVLTDRQFEAFARFVTGENVADVGRMLDVTQQRASELKRQIHKRLGFANDAEMVAYAIVNGLVMVEP